VSLLVIDASVSAAWVLPNQMTASALGLFRLWSAYRPIAPYIHLIETRSLLLKGERRRWLSSQQVEEAIAQLTKLNIAIEPPLKDQDLDRVSSVARASGLSFYDAIYLDLAIRTDAELATRDLRLGAACVHAGVGVIDLN
jgi:predicted nucleic acid-binding protein